MRPVYVIAGCEGEMRWVLLKSQVQVGEEAWVMEPAVLLSGWACREVRHAEQRHAAVKNMEKDLVSFIM